MVSLHLALSLAREVEAPRLGAVGAMHAAEKREALADEAEVDGATVAGAGGEEESCRAETRDVLPATGATRGQDSSTRSCCCG